MANDMIEKLEMMDVNLLIIAYLDVLEKNYRLTQLRWHCDDKGMIAKKFALAFGIAVVFPAMIHNGAGTFFPEPRWQDYTVSPLIDGNSSAYREKEGERRAAERVFEKHLFTVAVPLGLAAIVAGAFLAVQAVGTGLMFGGIFSVCDGYVNYWGELSAQLKFFSLLAAFLVLIVVGYLKVERQHSLSSPAREKL
jgi:hypothetical protein